jgi:hypothetical protein
MLRGVASHFVTKRLTHIQRVHPSQPPVILQVIR